MKSYLVLGLGRFGKSIAIALTEMGHDVLGVDNNEQVVQEMSEIIAHVVTSECTSEEFLKSVGVKNFDAAIVAMGNNVQSSILTTALLKELDAKYILAKANSDLHTKVLIKIGANKVVFPERDIAIRAANSLVTSNIVDMIQLSQDYSIVEITPPPTWIGKTIGELAIRSRYSISILAVKGQEGKLTIAPQVSTMFNENDTALVMGKNSDINTLQSLKPKKNSGK